MSLATLEAVSICTASTALIEPTVSSRRRASTWSGLNSVATVAFEHLDINAEPGGGVAPIESELAALQDEDFVAA